MSEYHPIEEGVLKKEDTPIVSIGQLIMEKLAEKETKGQRHEEELTKKNIAENTALAKKWLTLKDEELAIALEQPVDEVNDELSTPNLKHVVNRLNHLAEKNQQDSKEKVRFINVDDQVQTSAGERKVKAIVYSGIEKWEDKIFDLMSSEEGIKQNLAFISGANFMDNNPVYNENRERLVYLPLLYLTIPISSQE